MDQRGSVLLHPAPSPIPPLGTSELFSALPMVRIGNLHPQGIMSPPLLSGAAGLAKLQSLIRQSRP